MRWPAIYCVTLRKGRVIRGRAYYDRSAVLGAGRPATVESPEAPAQSVQPTANGRVAVGEIADLDLINSYVRARTDRSYGGLATLLGTGARLIVPDYPMPLSGAAMVDAFEMASAPWFSLNVVCECWAAAPGLAFLEWRLVGNHQGRPVTFRAAERLLLANGRIAETRVYFDTLALADPAAPGAAADTIFDAPPLVPLSDGAGEVVALGPAVTRFKIGDLVCPIYLPDWQDGPLSADRTGAGWAVRLMAS